SRRTPYAVHGAPMGPGGSRAPGPFAGGERCTTPLLPRWPPPRGARCTDRTPTPLPPQHGGGARGTPALAPGRPAVHGAPMEPRETPDTEPIDRWSAVHHPAAPPVATPPRRSGTPGPFADGERCTTPMLPR